MSILPTFVHLRLHSEYSIVDGTIRLGDAVACAAQDSMPALALTDLANLFGMVKFYTAARSNGIKPIVGCDVYITSTTHDPMSFERGRSARLLLLVRSHAGYLRLCELLTQAYLAPRQGGRAEISYQMFAAGDNSGLIALSGAAFGDVGQAILAGNLSTAEKLAQAWQGLFPGAFYLEIQRYGHPHDELLVTNTVVLAERMGLPVVATHPVQFLAAEDFQAHEARVCVAEGMILGNARRPRNFTAEQYFKTQQEMQTLFADFPEALTNSVEIAKRCNFSVELGKSKLPDFPVPDNLTIDGYLSKQAQEGLEKRLIRLYPEPLQREAKREEYVSRLAFEIAMIVQMGFAGYFLIVADFINWAKNNGVPVGPGRGSGAGSLVAYSLGITDLDPLHYALLFERFLNPERVSMPDFDVDFCQDNRYKVIEYVRQKYGAAAVSQIATFGTMAAKAVIRDVGRVLDLPYHFCDQLSKLIPNEIGISLKLAREKEPLLNERIAAEDEVRELFDLAEKLEGLPRNVGMHAGGVLIAPGKLTDFCPLYSTGTAESVISQFDKDDVEQIGLVKFDFLGLRNLTIIQLALDYVKRLEPDFHLQLEDLAFDDPAAYQILRDANTTAIFQVESAGMRKLLAKLQPDRFEDIIAVLALYRPGPLGSGMVDDFILRKKGQQLINYFHPKLEACLAPTYGVIVYQEQVMQISQIIGGYTLGAADLLRRAMGKKKAEEMALHRDIFREGAQKIGYDERLSMQLFDLMEKFAEYGFNKSHTAAYAVITYQTAWLKAHHCSAFMAATLSSDMDDTDAVKLLFEDAIANQLKILGPDINTSEYRFLPLDRQIIRYGLGAIKGTGEAAIRSIVEARERGGPFVDLFDFCCRLDKRVVNRRVIEGLVRAGAFDLIDNHRARLLASVGFALEVAEQAERDLQQVSLFDTEDMAYKPALVEAARWSEREQLLEEKQALGFFLSGHPFNEYQQELKAFVRLSLDKLEPQKGLVFLAGIVVATRTQMTRRGKMIFITLDDATTTVEVSVFNELFETERNKIREDELLVIEGKVSHDDFTGGLRVVAERILTLAQARGHFAKGLKLRMGSMTACATGNKGMDVEKLRSLLAPFCGGPCPIKVYYHNETAQCELSLGSHWHVHLEDALLAGLRENLQDENVEIVY